ncbi:MAG: hypothetical protein EON87_01030 [Brevundimonas sp.]|nr:MAG: hypothetical protein EON87_01030 [Brevundimonas sp.]
MDGWTDARIAETKKRWLEGQSATEIAVAIGGGLSRNAVIGKVHRLGFAREGRAAAAKPTVVRAPRPPRAPKVKAEVRPKPPHPGPQKKPAIVFGQTFLETPASDEQRATFRKLGLTMVERVEMGCGVESPHARPFLESRGCKWPLAGGMVCCSPIARGVYCEGHASVAYLDRPNKMKQFSAVESNAVFHTRNERIDLYRPRMAANDDGTLWDSGRAAA